MLIQRMWNFYLLRMDALDEMDELRRRRTIHRLLARIETKAALRMQRRFRAQRGAPPPWPPTLASTPSAQLSRAEGGLRPASAAGKVGVDRVLRGEL